MKLFYIYRHLQIELRMCRSDQLYICIDSFLQTSLQLLYYSKLLENSSEFKSTLHHETIMSACQECGPSFHVLRYIINTEKVHQMHDCVSLFINYCSLWDFLALPNSGILSESNIITISLCKHVVFSIPRVLETSLLIHMVY